MTEETPVKINGRMQDVVLEDLDRELVKIQAPAA
jgi:hypothetical protein